MRIIRSADCLRPEEQGLHTGLREAHERRANDLDCNLRASGQLCEAARQAKEYALMKVSRGGIFT